MNTNTTITQKRPPDVEVVVTKEYIASLPKRFVDPQAIVKKSAILQDAMRSVHRWVSNAFELRINIDRQIEVIRTTLFDALEHKPTSEFDREAMLTRQITIYTVFCNQIIRKIMQKALEDELKLAYLSSTNKDLIDLFESRYIRFIPEAICYDKTAVVVGKYCTAINILILMRASIKKDNNGIIPFNLFNRCSY